jgi:Flp pilus assembly protein TadD
MWAGFARTGIGWKFKAPFWLLVAGVVLLAAGWVIWRRPRPANPPPAADDPRLASVVPARNIRPDIGYVGDPACADCHPDIAASYRQHPMGRSTAPEASLAATEHYEAAAHNPFEAAGFVFQVERRGDHVVHRTMRRDTEGKPVCTSEAEVQIAVGAGRRGRSYLVNRDGTLYQSPVSWYAERGVWDLSPHLGGTIEQLYRPVVAQCLFCHCNSAEPLDGAGNRFVPPVIRGDGIGCERCHGPGALHVAARTRGDVVEPAMNGGDDTIVNPSRLAPQLREAVCEQCHLTGICRVQPWGRGVFDYRPGLALHDFWSVFVRPANPKDGTKFASHVEQMASSRCFRESQGKLGCIACHDPHALPATERRESYYRDRCLACHAERGCSLPAEVRQRRQPPDSCIGCHMPRFATSNLAHMASTDHRILRGARDEGRGASILPSPPGGEESRMRGSDAEPLVNFYREQLRANDRAAERDLGVAAMDLASVRQPEPVRHRLAEMALPRLQAAVERTPDDAPAWQAKGYALWVLDHKEAARADFEQALTLAPGREETLAFAAGLATQLGQEEAAAGYWQRLRAINPYYVRAHAELARLLAQRGDWPGAVDECQAALRLDPFQAAPRRLLVLGRLHTGRRDDAEAECLTLVRLFPREAEKIRAWFEQELKAAGYMRR